LECQLGDFVIKTFQSSPRSRILQLLSVLPAISLFIWVGAIAAIHGNYLVSAAFVAAAFLLLVFLMFQLTLRVEVDEHSVTRSWLFGSTVVPVGEINRLRWGGARGVLVLTISYDKKRSIQLSTNALAEQELREIQKEVLVGCGLEGEPLLPLFAEQVGYVDIDEMSKRKHQLHASASIHTDP
jgi:hypothetical protein